MSVGAAYPVHVDATLDAPLSRWLWLVKWLLVIPHYFVLAFLWLAFVVVSVVAFFTILFGGRYPRALFAFNLGVLRWSWRVAYYSYGALGTDRYPPFSLAEVPDYPAHFDVDYPEHLSRPLVLVKWWLLAIPHYLIVGVFAGGGVWIAWQSDRNPSWGSGGLIGLLVLIAAIALAFTGRYPRQLFDFVLGLNRWVLRVAAYAALMTDAYPPFRLELGGHETGATMTLAPSAPAPGTSAASVEAPPVETTSAPAGTEPPAGGVAGGAAPLSYAPVGYGPVGYGPVGWSAGRVASLVAGCVIGVAGLGLCAGGGAATWLDNTQRNSAGYLTSDTHDFATTSYALTSDRIDLGRSGVVAPAAILGTVRFQVRAVDPTRPVFIGVARRAAAESYLAGVAHAVVTNWSTSAAAAANQNGGAPSLLPARATIWAASATGMGTQSLVWEPSGGEWQVVVMNANGAAGVAVSATAAATIPALGWIAAGLFVAGIVLLGLGTTLVVVPALRASRRPPDARAVSA